MPLTEEWSNQLDYYRNLLDYLSNQLLTEHKGSNQIEDGHSDTDINNQLLNQELTTDGKSQQPGPDDTGYQPLTQDKANQLEKYQPSTGEDKSQIIELHHLEEYQPLEELNINGEEKYLQTFLLQFDGHVGMLFYTLIFFRIPLIVCLSGQLPDIF